MKPIKTQEDCEVALDRISWLMEFDHLTPAENDELTVLAILVQDFEKNIEFPPQTVDEFLAHVNYHTDRLINILDLKFETAYEQWDYRQKMKMFVQTLITGEG